MVLLVGAQAKADVPPQELIDALFIVESSGNDNAEGDKYDKKGNLKPPSEWSYGPLQISQECVDDYNKWYRTAYKAQDCKGNRALSLKICKAYINHYATAKRLGRKPTIEDMARIWNGGPNGWKKESTQKYWRGVKEHLGH
jgi:hypothetical protein